MAPVPGDSSKHQIGTSMPQGGHPPHHSITSSGRTSRDGGTSSRSALAVFRLITSSYLVGARTGRSAGFSPRRRRVSFTLYVPAARMTSAHFAMSASRLKRIPGRGGGEFRYPTLAPRRNPTPERTGTTTILLNERAVIPNPPTKY